MSRIKYPGEQEMKRQIQVILDESGMFEDDEKSQGYTECVQVKKRPAVKTAILFPLAAAAVMFLVVTAAGLIPQQTNSRVEPMTNVLTDDTNKISIKNTAKRRYYGSDLYRLFLSAIKSIRVRQRIGQTDTV